MTEEEATVQEQGDVSSTDAAANAAYEQTKRMLTLRQMQGVLDDLNAGVLNEKDPRVQMGLVAGAEILSGLPGGTLFDADGIRAATGGACSTPSELSQSVLKILKDAQENDFFYNSRIASAEKDEDWAEVSRLCNEASFGDDKTRYLQQWTPEQVAHLKTRNRNVERSLGFMSYAMGKGMDDPGVLTGFKTAIVMSRGGDLDAMVEQGVFDNLTSEQLADALYVADAMRSGSEMGVLDVLGQIPKGFADELGNVVRGAAWKLSPDDEAKAMRLADLSRKHGGDLDKLYADAKDYASTTSELVPMSDIGRYWNNKARWASDMERWVKAGDLARKRIEAKSILSQLDDAKFLGRGAAGEYLYEAMYMLGSGAAQLVETVVAASAGSAVGGPLGGLAATAAVFGASEVGRSRDEFIAAGMSAKDADALATAIGAATGVIELTGDFFQFGSLFRRLGVNLAAGGTPAQRAVREAAKRAAQKKPGLVGKARIEEEVAQLAGAKASVVRRIGRVAKDAAKTAATEFVEEGVSQAAASAMKLSGDWWSVEGERMFTARGELESFIEAMEQTAKYGFWQILPGFAANRALRGGGDAPAALRAEGISQARDGTARLRMRGVTLHDATAAEIAAQAARETRSSARMSGVPLKVIKDWKEGMTQEERERVIGEQKLTEEQVATLDATAHARALAEAAGDQTLTLEEEVVEINRQIEKLGEADEEEAVQMLDAELLAEEEAARAEEEARSESPKAEEETRNEGEGAPRAEVPAEAKPEAGGGEASSRRELDALRVRAAELDDRLRAKGLRKAKRNKIAEELAGVQARMQELSGGNLVLFSRGDGAQGRPALSPTKAALRDRLLLKIARTAGIRVIREGTEQITASARNAEARGLSFKREAFPATAEERAGIEREAKGKGAWLKAPNGKPTNLTPEQWVTVRTRAFKEWFGDWENDAKNASKVVDGNGEPMVVYHGTNADPKFYQFSHKFSMRNGAALGRGFYFSEDKSVAEGYGNDVIPVFLNIKKPLEPAKNKITKKGLKRVIRHIDPNGDTIADYASSDRGYPGKEWYERSLDEAVDAIFSDSQISDSEILGEMFSVWGGEAALRGVVEVLGYDGFVPKNTLSDDVKIAFLPEQIKSATENVGTFDAGNPDIRYSRGEAEREARGERGGDKVLRDGEGVVYGYWDEARGELHLNEDFADFDTPLHEWAHVWLSWVRKNDARVAERALALTKETKFYKELRADEEGAYAGLSDDALAEEAFAMLCGKDGGEIMSQEGVSTWTKLRRAVLNVFKAALRTLGVSESVLSRLTFRDMQSLCLRDLLDEETFSLKELRASVSAKRALEDAATEAVIDNGIEEASRKRAIRSASVAAAGKLLMRRDRMSREQVESAETLSALEESVGRMLPTETYDVVKSAAKAAQLAAKVVYSSRAKGDAATVDATDAVREANRATRILRAQRVLKAANRAGQIDADMYADAREYAENYTKMTAAGRRSHARGINPTQLKHLYGAEVDDEAFSRDFLARGEGAKDMTGAIADIVRGELPMDAAPYDVLNATRETLRNAYAHQARTWVPSASRERALRLAEAIDVEDTLAGVMKAARTAEAFLREHGVRQAAEATMKNMTRFLRAAVSDASDAAKPTDKRRYSAEFHVFADALLRHLKVYDKARRAIEKARKAKTGKDKAEEEAAAALDAAAAGAEAEVRKVIVELDALENSGDAHGAAAFDAMNAKLSALQLLTNFDPTDAEGVAEIYAEVQEAAHEDAANKKNERERFADRVERDAQALTAALNAREGVEQYDQQFEGKRYVSWLFKYAYGLKQRTESLIRFATGATRRNAERVSNTNHLREVRANTEKEKNKLRRVRAFRAMLSETMGLETDAQVREFSRKMAKKRDELAKFSRSGKVAMSYDQALNLYLGLRQEHVSGRMLGMDAGVRAKLLERNREARILWEQIQKMDELRDALERAGVLRYGDGLVRLLEAERARLDDAATAYFGTALRVYPGTKLYFPIVRMRREATPLTPNATGQANVVPSSALPRVANYRPLDDAQTATGAFFGQIEETEHFAAYGGLSRYYTLLFLNKEFSRVLWDKAGSRVFQQFRKSAADTVNGQFYSADDVGASALMNAAVNITSVLALGFNVGTAIKQMGSFLAFANEIGWTRTFKALLFSDSGEGRLERIEEMTSHPLWAARFQGAGSFHDAKNLAAYGSTTLAGGWWKRYAEASMVTVRLGDALAVLTVGQGLYGATKAKLMRRINARTGALYTEAEARDEAMGFVMDLADRTQQAGRTANFSAYQRGAKATYRVIGQFMSSTSQMWAMEARALEDIAARGIADKAARDRLLTVMMNNHVVNPVVVWGATLLVQLLFKGELPDEDNATDLIWAMLLGPLGGIFLVGGSITGMFEDTGYADTAFPSLSMMARTGKNAVGFAKSLADEEEGATKKAAYRFLRDASAPTRQAAQLIDAWVKDLDGRESGNEAFN